jgi:hypothetical protein
MPSRTKNLYDGRIAFGAFSTELFLGLNLFLAIDTRFFRSKEGDLLHINDEIVFTLSFLISIILYMLYMNTRHTMSYDTDAPAPTSFRPPPLFGM